MSSGKVLVVGALHYDIVVNAPHLPRADETVMGRDVAYVCGGKGGNQAVAASRHGAPTMMAGRVGDDRAAAELLANLRRAGVDTTLVQRTENTASGMSVAIVDAGGDYGAVVVSAANRDIVFEDIAVPENVAVLLLQNEIPEAINIRIAALCRKNGAKVVLNAAPMRAMPDRLLDQIDFLVLNRIEAETYFGEALPTVSVAQERVGKRGVGLHHLIVTLGAQGFISHETGSAPRHFPAADVDVVSSHGAGDCFVGAFAARLASGAGSTDALIYAGAAASRYVSTPVENRMTNTSGMV